MKFNLTQDIDKIILEKKLSFYDIELWYENETHQIFHNFKLYPILYIYEI